MPADGDCGGSLEVALAVMDGNEELGRNTDLLYFPSCPIQLPSISPSVSIPFQCFHN